LSTQIGYPSHFVHEYLFIYLFTVLVLHLGQRETQIYQITCHRKLQVS